MSRPALLDRRILRISEALGADIGALGIERGHRTLTVLRESGKIVTIPVAPRTARAIDLVIVDRLDGPILLRPDGRSPDRGTGRSAGRHQQAGWPPPAACVRHRHPRHRRPLSDLQEAASCADPRTTMGYDQAGLPGPPRHLHRRHLPRRRRPLTTLGADRRLARPTRDLPDDVAPAHRRRYALQLATARETRR
jgi:hypothetical protein